MNIGQVLEVHLGYAAKALGWKIMTPVFDGAHEQDIFQCLKDEMCIRDRCIKTTMFSILKERPNI